MLDPKDDVCMMSKPVMILFVLALRQPDRGKHGATGPIGENDRIVADYGRNPETKVLMRAPDFDCIHLQSMRCMLGHRLLRGRRVYALHLDYICNRPSTNACLPVHYPCISLSL